MTQNKAIKMTSTQCMSENDTTDLLKYARATSVWQHGKDFDR